MYDFNKYQKTHKFLTRNIETKNETWSATPMTTKAVVKQDHNQHLVNSNKTTTVINYQ